MAGDWIHPRGASVGRDKKHRIANHHVSDTRAIEISGPCTRMHHLGLGIGQAERQKGEKAESNNADLYPEN